MSRAPYASDPAASRGRRHSEPGDGRGALRSAFQRDRDRIVHSTGFRRLRHKTQVFLAPEGDHYRVRLTHSLEVAQIGRTIARALGLDEDLTEALCLAHDIGHPPFGHAGEAALGAALADVGGFDHNGHTLRTVTLLDSPYPAWAGLNLSWETLEGLAKHNGPVRTPRWALAAVDRDYPLDLGLQASLEAQVAALADDIAYDNHDIDDGLRAGLLSAEQVLAQPFLADSWARVRRRYPGAREEALLRELVREQIGLMVGDLIATTRARIAAHGIATAQEVRAAEEPLAAFSAPLAEGERGFKRFMYDELYHHPQQRESAQAAQGVVAALAAAYTGEPHLLPPAWRDALRADEPWRTRAIGDFIAGMSDRYALARYAELVGPPANLAV